MKLTYNKNKLFMALFAFTQALVQVYVPDEAKEAASVAVTLAASGIGLKAQTVDKDGNNLETKE